MREARVLRGLELLIVAAVCGFAFFYGLAHFGLVGADEPRYAQIAREMVERRDWITPLLYGKPWLEKPVLYYWTAIVSYKIFGVSDWAARFPTAVLGTAMVFAIYAFAQRFRPGARLNAALITASCAGVIGFARAASTDMPLTATLTIGMLSWITWQQSGEKRWLAIFYGMVGLAMLAKGPVAPALAAMVIVLFAAVRRDWRLILRTLWLPGIALFLAVMLPWYIAVEHSTHEFFRVFILKHNLARYETNVFQHRQPFWYYAVVLPTALLPWTLFAVAGFVRAVRERRDEVLLLLAIWAAVPVVFFSFSGSKLPGYILPALPAWALLAAWYLETLREKILRMRFAIPHALIVGVIFGAALLSSYFILKLRPTASAWTIGGIGAAAVFAVVLLATGTHGLRAIRMATLVPILVALAFVLRYVAPAIDAKQSARPVAEALAQRRVPSDAPAVAYNLRRELVYGLGFYRNQPMLYPAITPPPAPDFVYITALPDRDFVCLIGAGTRGFNLPEDRAGMPAGGYAPQRVRFLYVPAARAMSHPDTKR
jgi:4-amino-4-deoxy-L-arabinose transferase-like glycosyltransferase